MNELECYKPVIRGTLNTLISCFLYYDRKEDEDLPVGKIEEVVRGGHITIDEIVEQFREELERGLGGNDEKSKTTV